MHTPYISKELIDYLDSVYTNRLPDYEDVDYETLKRRAAQLEVVQHIEMLYHEQQNSGQHPKVIKSNT